LSIRQRGPVLKCHGATYHAHGIRRIALPLALLLHVCVEDPIDAQSVQRPEDMAQDLVRGSDRFYWPRFVEVRNVPALGTGRLDRLAAADG